MAMMDIIAITLLEVTHLFIETTFPNRCSALFLYQKMGIFSTVCVKGHTLLAGKPKKKINKKKESLPLFSE